MAEARSVSAAACLREAQRVGRELEPSLVLASPEHELGTITPRGGNREPVPDRERVLFGFQEQLLGLVHVTDHGGAVRQVA